VSGVVVDTSEWVEYFAGRPASALVRALAAAQVVVPPIVIAELLSGARRSRDRATLVDLLRDLPIHDADFDHWIRVGDLRRALRAKGLDVSTPDAHVAQCALDRDAPLATRDGIFKHIARHTSLTLEPHA